MPRKITQADIDHVWHVYKSMHGTRPLTEEEVARGVQVLLRTGKVSPEQRRMIIIKFVSGRNQTRFVSKNQYNINLKENGTWEEIVHHLAWRCGGTPAVELRLSRRACESNFLLGAMKPVPKPVVKLTKEEVRAGKIERLEARLAVWQRKQDRAKVWIRKINRSLTAYRRHEP